MGLHIESLTADVTMFDGELPLSERQISQLAERVLALLAKRNRDVTSQREATEIKRSAQPPPSVAG